MALYPVLFQFDPEFLYSGSLIIIYKMCHVICHWQNYNRKFVQDYPNYPHSNEYPPLSLFYAVSAPIVLVHNEQVNSCV